MLAYKLLIQVLFTAVMLVQQAAAQGPSIAVMIDATKTGEPISPYLYGQFIEHIGGLITNNIWSEMLDDRKFYYPMESKPAGGRGRGGMGNPGMRGAMRRWAPIGASASIVMDASRPYAGEQSPLVKLDGTEARGIRQSGLMVVKDKSYTGRVVLAGDPGVQVTVNLVWGAAYGERQSVPVGKLGPAYAKFPLKFKAMADSANAQLEIVGTGIK